MKLLLAIMLFVLPVFSMEGLIHPDSLKAMVKKSGRHRKRMRKSGVFNQIQQMVSDEEPPEEYEQHHPRLPPPPPPPPPQPRRGPPPPPQIIIPDRGRYVEWTKYHEDQMNAQKNFSDIKSHMNSQFAIIKNLQEQNIGLAKSGKSQVIVSVLGSSGFVAMLGIITTILTLFVRKKKKNGNGGG